MSTITEPTEVRFKRVLGLPSLVFFGLAYMVPLTVWTTYGIVTTSTEGHLPLAYTVTTIAMGLTACRTTSRARRRRCGSSSRSRWSPA